MINTTIVTGIWDLNRDSLSANWSRSFQHYIDNFESLLQNLPGIPLIVFIDPEYEYLVWKHRTKENTKVYYHTKNEFNGNFFPFFDKIQEIRNSPDWLSGAGWLPESTQAKMDFYNPMVMSKMFLLHNAKIFNPFNTEYIFWLDGGITNTVHPGYFSKDRVLDSIQNIVEKFLFICFPYKNDAEIHGFKSSEMNKFAGNQIVDRVARGGFFGGHVNYISKANELYYNLLQNSLYSNLMGTEENIFTLMTYLDPDTYKYFMINEDGLISTFFENIKNNIKNNPCFTIEETIRKPHHNNDILLYINTFNTPDQLQLLFDSFEQYDINFINKTKKILINNSTNETLLPQYNDICNRYNISEHILKGNLGVCGARQFAAEHFANSESKYMMFFEDDMLIDLSNNICSFGFNKNISNNLFNDIIKIMSIEKFDLLKFSFSEFYGHNGEQWSWHNVPSEQKIQYFGNINKRPDTKFNNIKSYNGIPYADGEIYYSNWPHIIDQEGNQKLFLDTKWNNPFEQTWMSHCYTLSRNNKVRTGILLASPITHNRIYFYEGAERKEN
jgi:hypothetical protein